MGIQLPKPPGKTSPREWRPPQLAGMRAKVPRVFVSAFGFWFSVSPAKLASVVVRTCNTRLCFLAVSSSMRFGFVVFVAVGRPRRGACIPLPTH
jgi:hypothetical protein